MGGLFRRRVVTNGLTVWGKDIFFNPFSHLSLLGHYLTKFNLSLPPNWAGEICSRSKVVTPATCDVVDHPYNFSHFLPNKFVA